MSKSYTVRVLLFGREEAIIYEEVHKVEYEDYHVKIFAKDGIARIREDRLDLIEELTPE